MNPGQLFPLIEGSAASSWHTAADSAAAILLSFHGLIGIVLSGNARCQICEHKMVA